MANRRKFKQTPVLTEEEAYRKLNHYGFYDEVYKSVYNLMSVDFIAHFVRDPYFKNYFRIKFKKVFDDAFYGDRKNIVREYHKKFGEPGKSSSLKNPHYGDSFYNFVVDYIDDEVELFFLGKNPTDGYGAIY
jgi:hypothetical protein